jgi:hypothetical protein
MKLNVSLKDPQDLENSNSSSTSKNCKAKLEVNSITVLP